MMKFSRAHAILWLYAALIAAQPAAFAQETPAPAVAATPTTPPASTTPAAAIPATPVATPAGAEIPPVVTKDIPATTDDDSPPVAVESDETPAAEYESCPAIAGALPPPPVDVAALEREAQSGNPAAAFDLANEDARLGKFAEAEKWYRFALYKGEGRAALALVDLHSAGSIKLDDPESIRSYGLNLMEESAKKGGGGSAMNLALLYLYGKGSSKDYEKARDWLLIAEGAGKPMASYELGMMYTNGLYLDVAPRRAFHYFEKAAAAGIAPATRQVAIAYHTGIGAAKNLDKAITCYTRAAEQGDVLAMRDLGNIYKLERPGAGSADAWYNKAAALKDPDALYYLGRYQEAAKRKHHLSRIIADPDYVPHEDHAPTAKETTPAEKELTPTQTETAPVQKPTAPAPQPTSPAP